MFCHHYCNNIQILLSLSLMNNDFRNSYLSSMSRFPWLPDKCSVRSRVPWSWHYLNHLNNRVWHLICRGQFITTLRRKYFPLHHVIFSSNRVDIYFVPRNMKQSEAKNHGNVTTIPSITQRDFLMPSSDYVYEACSYVCTEIHTWYSQYNSHQLYKPLSHTLNMTTTAPK